MGSRLRFRATEVGDLAPVASDLRAEDAQEVMASHGHTPEQALRFAWMASRWAFTIVEGDKPLGLFGVADIGEGTGSPWMLATTELTWHHPREFLMGSKKVVEQMQQSFTSLENYVDARNLTSIRWLRWLGFTIHPAAPFGVAGMPFHRFTWERS